MSDRLRNTGNSPLTEPVGLRLRVTPMGRDQIRDAVALVDRRPGCTCDSQFFPTAMDVDCPLHGLAAFVRQRLERDAQRGGAAA